MQIITEKINTPVSLSCDVLVAGGGFAGISAALAAARTGADVLLIEREYMLGGLGTAGLVTIYLPLCDGMGEQVSFGIAEELLRLSIKHGAEDRYPKAWLEGGTKEEKTEKRFQVQFNPHMFAFTSEKLLQESGVRILYGTHIVAAHMDGKKITAVSIENKSGRSAVQIKKSVVDCTGDADICKFTGAKTSLFEKKNILAAWHYYISNGALKLRMLGAADMPGKGKEWRNKETPLAKRRFQGIDGNEINEFVQLSHEKTYADILAFMENDPTHVPVTIPSIPQLRMTRRICGKYTMDIDEIRKDFPDSVGMFGDWTKKGPAYHLPFSTLYGDDVENLICAGRCISVTDAMWNVTRVIPVCAVSGQAAGTAAAMTNNFHALDISLLQQKLQEDGVKL